MESCDIMTKEGIKKGDIPIIIHNTITNEFKSVGEIAEENDLHKSSVDKAIKKLDKEKKVEVKEEKGLGTTLDVILYDGKLKTGDTIIIGGIDQPIITKVKVLLEPQPLAEISDKKTKFKAVKEVVGAAGIKISAQGIREVRTIEIFFSRSVSIILQPEHAQALQPNPKIIGMIVFPWTPIECINLSKRNAARGKYPESCKISIIKKKGITYTITPPTAPKKPPTPPSHKILTPIEFSPSSW